MIEEAGKTVKFVVHTFSLSDVEDPDLFAGEYFYKWEKSEAGQYIMEHSAPKPMWHRHSPDCRHLVPAFLPTVSRELC
jgi:hypothetical protein